MSNEKILVTGATGQLGTRTVHLLSKRIAANRIVAGGRSAAKAPPGVEFRVLDYDRPDTIAAALKGVARVVLISGNELGKRVAQHKAVIDASVRAGVRLLAYTSILKADTNPMLLAAEHRGTEEVLAASGLPFISLRNGWYNENFAAGAAPAVQHGVMQSASRAGRIASAAREDFAEAAAELILRDDHPPARAYELAGSTSFSKQEYAELLARRSGRKVALQDLTGAQYAAALVQAGLPQVFADILADSDARAAEGWLFDDSRTLERVIGRPTTTLERTLDAVLPAS